jgi:hypothetical protein
MPITTLWDKFVSALRWTRQAEAAAVATIHASPAAQAEKLLITTTSTTSKPSLSTAGANVEGHRTVNLYAYQDNVFDTFTLNLRVWGRAPGAWVALGEVELNQTAGAAPALDVEGYARVEVEVLSITASAPVKIGIFPYNAETP